MVSLLRSRAPLPCACASTAGRSTPAIRTDGHRSRMASAIEPPINPRPTTATLLNGGSEVDDDIRQIPNPKSQTPNPNAIAADWDLFGTWDLVIGIWDLGFLPRPPAPRHGFEADAAADCRRDDAQLCHQAIEL